MRFIVKIKILILNIKTVNKEIRFFIILASISITTMIVVNFINIKEGHLPLTAINTILMGLVAFWVAVRLNKRSAQLRVFGLFFFLFSLFTLLMTLPHLYLLFPHLDHEAFNQSLHWGYVIGHIFLYLSLAVFIRLPLHWAAPRLKNLGSAFFVILGAVTTLFNILLPNTPNYIHATGITMFNADPLVGKLVAINVVLAWVPAGIYFIVKGIRSQEKVLRSRSLLLGIGLMIATIGGPLHDISQKEIVFLIADIVVLIGIVVLGSGVLYQKEEKIKTLP